MKAMENELKEKVKVDRGLLNSWFIEVQRSKVRLRMQLFALRMLNRLRFDLVRRKLTNFGCVVIQRTTRRNNFAWPFKK